MTIQMHVTSPRACVRAIEALTQLGYDARAAADHPTRMTTVVVSDVRSEDAPTVRRIIAGVDTATQEILLRAS